MELNKVGFEPGAELAEEIADSLGAEAKPVIGKNEVEEALQILQKYKDDKANLETRIVDNEQWWKGRHWPEIRRQYSQGDKRKEQRPEPTSAWLFNSIANKHADIMDNIPVPSILPRERMDEADATSLSEIVPVIMERNHYEDTYSKLAWYKLIKGAAATGVFWDSTAENGLGDISIQKIDLLNLFWEAGISDIQQSKNLFIVKLEDKDVVDSAWPELKGKADGQQIDVKKYVTDDNIDTQDKVLIVDWYYKKTVGTRKVLHFAKIVGGELVYASENDTQAMNGQQSMAEKGWYGHGMYPVVIDQLFPEEGTPVGFGFVDIMKSPQTYIDKIDQLVLENTMRVAKTRYFARGDGVINLEDFADLSKEIVTVNGGSDMDSYIKKIEQGDLNLQILNYVEYKRDELKETSGNRDVNQGGSSGGVTAAAAISALQEAGNKTSRDFINASYRAYAKVVELVIELIREFYNVGRSFRIEGPDGVMRFVQYSNARLQQQSFRLPNGDMGSRKPVFDIKVSAQRKSAFSTLTQNELAKELYGAGFFNPQLASQALMAIELMEFEGKDKIKEMIQRNQQMFQMQQMMAVQAAANGGGAVMNGTGNPSPTETEGEGQESSIPADNGIAGAVRNSTTSYAQQMAQRAVARVQG